MNQDKVVGQFGRLTSRPSILLPALNYPSKDD